MTTRTSRSVIFPSARRVEIRSEEVTPSSKELVVKAICSAISAGTEMLLYRGEAPEELEADVSLASLSGSLQFPLKYGYCAVGEVVEAGAPELTSWLGKRVFAFHPHQSVFAAEPDLLIALPESIEVESAVFLPNLETAVSLVQDARPLLGERVCVFGQGVVGLLVTSLLSRFSLSHLVTVDPVETRREISRSFGAHESLHPEELRAGKGEFDLCLEVSGRPLTLDQAIAVTGYGGRIVIGSGYGNKTAPLNLGGRFHRSRITLLSSQVSTLDPALRGRWDKRRRMDLCLEMLGRLPFGELITHRIPLEEAARAYQLLEERESGALQVLLTYPE